ncbi:MAG TPA: hypothetical protein VNY09_02500 [Candidatus Sulfotelmatobacter sp.]|nr:hypothetical protein [Candidatus Sulfotelmatobacter sp.]
MPRGWINPQIETPACGKAGRGIYQTRGYAHEESATADVEFVHESREAREWQRSSERILGATRSLLFGAISACLLLWVAFYNGYPTVYPDTGGYLYTGAFGIALFPFRSPGYGVFAVLTSLRASSWFTIVAQATILVAVLYESCEYLIGGDSRFRDHCLLGITAFLAAFSSLPWETSLLMPDVFAGVVFLSLFLLAFNGQMNWLDRIGLAAISVAGVGGHVSLLPIALLFVAALGITAGRWAPREAPSAKSVLPWLIVPLLAAGLWNANLNRQMGLGFKLSPSGNEFLLGRLLNDGLAGDYLRGNCPQRPYVACRYLGNLPKTPEQLLFWHPMLQEMEANGEEVREIVHGTLAAYPLRFAWNSAKHTLRQLVQFKTGDEVRDLALHATNSNDTVIGQVFPRDLGAYSASKLVQGRLIRLTKIVAVVDTVVFWLSAIACAIAAFSRRDEKWNRFLYSAILFLFFNAAVCATFAGVYDRYQSRVAWILPLCLVVFVCRYVNEKRREATLLRGNF